jgi:V/A-type H+-transporting ATPase subunit I
VIIEMTRVRMLGPRARLPEVLRELQDIGVLHLAEPTAAGPLATVELTDRQRREQRHLARALDDIEHVLTDLRVPPGAAGTRNGGTPETRELARWARLGGRLRRRGEQFAAHKTALEEERALILKYQHFFSAFRSLLESEARFPHATAYHVLLKGGAQDTVQRLRASLRDLIGDVFELYSQDLPSGELAVLVLVSSAAAGRVDRVLADARVEEIPIPQAYGGRSLTDAIPRMLARFGELPTELAAVERERAQLARTHGADLRRARAALHDRLKELGALPLSGVTAHAFVIEGWVPADTRADLETRLDRVFGGDVVVSVVAREHWASEDAPVVLRNPRLLRPFEVVMRLLPLPRYGTIDPTPFVAVFFPAFFGLILGDIGYGILLAIIALIVRARSRPGSTVRAVAEVAGACAIFAVGGGLLYGEFLGDLGRRWLGLRPLVMDREEALVPFLLLAVGLGVVHVVLGLSLGAISAWRRHPRQALGRGVSALMILLIVVALLAAVGRLPRAFFTPSVIALLVAFPVLIIAEGIVAPIELLSTLGNILSYARIMALGVASVMLAVVANRMQGAMGSAVVGIVFALLFHLVNFAVGIFSPTIHALRLHYVEFFGKFYSPGGVRYQPFGHWTRDGAPAR